MKIDTTIPHSGRMYDFVLGGHHNFEADRLAARRIIEIFPAYPTWARFNRWFLQYVAERWAQEGHASVLDLGSGLPTQGHFHEAIPSAQVLYTDRDPVAVVYGKQILDGMPGKAYIEVDLNQPSHLIEEATRVFGDRPKIAVGFIGVGYLLDDETVARLGRELHAWCAPGSVMAYTTPYEARELSPEQRQVGEEIAARFKDAKMTIYSRSPARVGELLAPWKIEDARLLQEWLSSESLLHESNWQESSFAMAGILLSHSPSA
jgi:O-methyltransferase involved in polyketide biosynthesis